MRQISVEIRNFPREYERRQKSAENSNFQQMNIRGGRNLQKNSNFQQVSIRGGRNLQKIQNSQTDEGERRQKSAEK